MPLRIVLIVVVAAIFTIVGGRLIGRVAERAGSVGRLAPFGDKARAQARSRTLGFALRGVLVGVVWTVVLLLIFDELGLNLGAFIATATVIGGAIGFGAQQLVRDVLAGGFIIGEDQFGVGDRVEIMLGAYPVRGTVERVTLRATMVRGEDGRAWWLSNGQITCLANGSTTTTTEGQVTPAEP